jgi:enamine deaminase RidA (YjgF/YER057c/UK114 family)
MSPIAPQRYLNPHGTCPAQGLYSHVGRADGGAVYCVAGQLSVGSDGSVIGKGDFDTQFQQVFANLGAVLTGLNADFNDVVKFTTYLVGSNTIERFMTLREILFPTLFAGASFPPNTLLVISRLVKEEFLLEVEAVVQAR